MRAKTSIAVSVVVAVLCSSMIPGVGIAEAATIRVPEDQLTIQAGLNAAAVGDVVLVASGTYAEHDISMSDGVTLRGETDDPADVVIDAQGLGRVIDCSDLSHPVAIIGITVANGLESEDGGGVRCHNASATLEDVMFQGNSTSAHSGGGMSCQGGTATLSDVTFRNNYAFLEGGGLYCGSGSTVDLSDVAFDGNEAGQGGGLGCEWANVTVANTYINGNLSFYASHGQGWGGGIWCKDSFLTLTDVTVSNNVASEGYGGGLHCALGQVVELSHVVFTGNEATWGGAVDCGWPSGSTTTLNLTNATLYGNIAEYGSGISCRVYSDVSLEATIIAGGIGGEAVWCEEVENPPSFTCCDIFGNEGGDWVGCTADQWTLEGNFSADPLLCLDENPSERFSLHEGSPCLPSFSPCGELVGAFAAGCGYPTAVEPTSWGAIKTLYR